ncbi:MAG: hypothetical protein PVI59_02210 [Anaerolineae bacterium]|jgi:hypothetical protein
MTSVEWLAWIVLMIVGLGTGAVVTLSNWRVAREVRKLTSSYRRQKSLELEQLQARLVAEREAEVKRELAQAGGVKRVLSQLLADALPETGAVVGREGVLDASISPAPRFTVAGPDGHQYLFTTAPDLLRSVRMLGRRDNVLPLDAAIHPAARAEIQAVWEHVAARRLRGPQPAYLPRQAAWYLVVRRREQQEAGE